MSTLHVSLSVLMHGGWGMFTSAPETAARLCLSIRIGIVVGCGRIYRRTHDRIYSIMDP